MTLLDQFFTAHGKLIKDADLLHIQTLEFPINLKMIELAPEFYKATFQTNIESGEIRESCLCFIMADYFRNLKQPERVADITNIIALSLGDRNNYLSSYLSRYNPDSYLVNNYRTIAGVLGDGTLDREKYFALLSRIIWVDKLMRKWYEVYAG